MKVKAIAFLLFLFLCVVESKYVVNSSFASDRANTDSLEKEVQGKEDKQWVKLKNDHGFILTYPSDWDAYVMSAPEDDPPSLRESGSINLSGLNNSKTKTFAHFQMSIDGYHNENDDLSPKEFLKNKWENSRRYFILAERELIIAGELAYEMTILGINDRPFNHIRVKNGPYVYDITYLETTPDQTTETPVHSWPSAPIFEKILNSLEFEKKEIKESSLFRDKLTKHEKDNKDIINANVVNRLVQTTKLIQPDIQESAYVINTAPNLERKKWMHALEEWRKEIEISTKNIHGKGSSAGYFAQSFVPHSNKIAAVELNVYPNSDEYTSGWLRVSIHEDDKGKPSDYILSRAWLRIHGEHSNLHGINLVFDIPDIEVNPEKKYWFTFVEYPASKKGLITNFGISKGNAYPEGEIFNFWKENDVEFSIISELAKSPPFMHKATSEELSTLPDTMLKNLKWNEVWKHWPPKPKVKEKPKKTSNPQLNLANLLKKAGMIYSENMRTIFLLPDDFQFTDVEDNPNLAYQYAIKHNNKKLEIRYLIKPLGLEASRYDDYLKSGANYIVPNHNTYYKSFFETTCQNVSGGNKCEITAFDPVEAKMKFGADAGLTTAVSLDSTFGKGYKNSLINVFHLQDRADVYIFYLFDDLISVKDVCFRDDVFRALQFRQKLDYDIQKKKITNEKLLEIEKESKLGRNLFEEKSYIEAKKALIAVANKGHTDAQFLLGRMYYKGYGVEKDWEKATQWFLKAAGKGHNSSFANLAEIYASSWYMSADKNKAEKWFVRKAVWGGASWPYKLGEMYYAGYKIKEDIDEAKKWFTLSGSYKAKKRLADIEYAGKGGWLYLQAKQGDVKAQYELGSKYRYGGSDVKQDHEKALKWLTLAARKGHIKAQTTLGDMYNIGGGVQKDIKEAIKWYKMAGERGGHSAIFSLYQIYDSGHKLKKDYVKAYVWCYQIKWSGGKKNAPCEALKSKMTAKEIIQADSEAKTLRQKILLNKASN